MSKFIKKITIILAILGLILSGWLWWDYSRFMDSPMPIEGQGINYIVEPGANLTRIANNLKQQGLITRPRYLLLHARIQTNAHRINTGEYFIKTGTTPGEFYQQLIEGKVTQYALTIVEGWSFRQMMDAIHSNEVLNHTLKELNFSQIMEKLGYPNQHPEGRFLPDTYHFPRGLTDEAFLKRAYTAMETLLTKEWEQREVGLPLKSPYEALILASIVEKETGLASERKAIAGVFTRRLQKRIRLQTDPTVIYGMGERYKGNIRKQDLLRDTPYNTYRRHGLPPTPIALPGKDAIIATLHPDNAQYLYFVSKGDGSHYFSTTLEEHNQAVIKYQLKGRKRSFSSYKNKAN
ncbi:MAG: endolytic transglycosylase MltG [Gammaproteobacteria bacterium]|nr:endolytic transglycosylase MltG [Gammaproteobacteria bacterium]